LLYQSECCGPVPDIRMSGQLKIWEKWGKVPTKQSNFTTMYLILCYCSNKFQLSILFLHTSIYYAKTYLVFIKIDYFTFLKDLQLSEFFLFPNWYKSAKQGSLPKCQRGALLASCLLFKHWTMEQEFIKKPYICQHFFVKNRINRFLTK